MSKMTQYKFIDISELKKISHWFINEESLTGTNPKKVLIGTDDKFFVFKRAKPNREMQIWSELIASFIAGDCLGWETQEVSIAKHKDQIGNLLPYIYDPYAEEFIEGMRVCREEDPKYDVRKGKRHTLPLVLKLHEKIGIDNENYLKYWARTLAFDSLISNTDRHAENWAFITNSMGNKKMAPFFDNAASLGCSIDEKVGLSRCFNGDIICNEWLQKFIDNGRHHIRLEEPGPKGTPFITLIQAFLKLHPEQKNAFEAVESLNLEEVFTLMRHISDLIWVPTPYKMSEKRVEHISNILIFGQERIRKALQSEIL